MAADAAPSMLWSQLSELIAHKTGLHFPADRHADLLRGLTSAARELGFADAAECAAGLLSSQLTDAQVDVLAGHLTVGETYFFRDRNTFDALAQQVLPELIERRRHERRLSIWSAACCTGEEAYSLAILLQQCLPDWRDWRITLVATDLNQRFLDKARAGVYGEWSFRDAPPGLKARWFTRTAEGRYALVPQVREMVKFARFNLVTDGFAGLGVDTRAMDLILCRNVLMYFTPAQAEKVVTGLHRLLREDGWLIVAGGEGSQMLPRFSPVSFPGTILYRKGAAPAPAAASVRSIQPVVHIPIPAPAPPATTLVPPAPSPPTRDEATLNDDQRKALAMQARALADQGKLAEALARCDQWIATDALDAGGRYLRAAILQEYGEIDQARRALQQAVYLQPDFVLAHFALGNLARLEGKADESDKHFGNALALLLRCAPDEVLPQSDGLTAGQLREIVASLIVSATT